MRWTAYIDDDAPSLSEGGRSISMARTADLSARSTGAHWSGEEFAGRSFEQWRALLQTDIAHERALWHSLSRKRGRSRRA
jgi:hypothetical protein